MTRPATVAAKPSVRIDATVFPGGPRLKRARTDDANDIAPATGAVLYQFRAVAYDGEPTRVDHLEQPVFAWR